MSSVEVQAIDAIGEDRLPGLFCAGGVDEAFGLVDAQAPLLPGEAAGCQKSPNFYFRLRRQTGMGDFDDAPLPPRRPIGVRPRRHSDPRL